MTSRFLVPDQSIIYFLSIEFEVVHSLHLDECSCNALFRFLIFDLEIEVFLDFFFWQMVSGEDLNSGPSYDLSTISWYLKWYLTVPCHCRLMICASVIYYITKIMDSRHREYLYALNGQTGGRKLPERILMKDTDNQSIRIVMASFGVGRPSNPPGRGCVEGGRAFFGGSWNGSSTFFLSIYVFWGATDYDA